MLQLDFLREILEKCKAAGIYTAGNVLSESFNIPNNSFLNWPRQLLSHNHKI